MSLTAIAISYVIGMWLIMAFSMVRRRDFPSAGVVIGSFLVGPVLIPVMFAREVWRHGFPLPQNSPECICKDDSLMGMPLYWDNCPVHGRMKPR